MWQHWLLGDPEQSVPPLKSLNGGDVVHLDNIPLPAGERRRPARKSLSDLKFLMADKVVAEGTWEDPPNENLATVTTMYGLIVQQYLVVRDDNPRHARRDPHMKWQTLVHIIRSRIKFQALRAAGVGAGEVATGRGAGGRGRGAGCRDVGAAPLGRGRGAGRDIPEPLRRGRGVGRGIPAPVRGPGGRGR